MTGIVVCTGREVIMYDMFFGIIKSRGCNELNSSLQPRKLFLVIAAYAICGGR